LKTHFLVSSSYASLVTWLPLSLCLESFVWPWLRFYDHRS